jgi:hypothetical protein
MQLIFRSKIFVDPLFGAVVGETVAVGVLVATFLTPASETTVAVAFTATISLALTLLPFQLQSNGGVGGINYAGYGPVSVRSSDSSAPSQRVPVVEFCASWTQANHVENIDSSTSQKSQHRYGFTGFVQHRLAALSRKEQAEYVS